MIEYINDNAFKMIVFFLLFSGGIALIALNRKHPKRLFFLLILYIPLSFKSLSGSLVVYLIILNYLLSLRFKDTDSQISIIQFDNILIALILIASTFSILNTGVISIVYFDIGKIRISSEYLVIITMLSNIAIYSMAKKFITSKEDLIKAIKFMVLSGTIASLAGYLQLMGADKTFIFKYIVISENPKWSNRIAATMQGYEMLAEYTAILIIFSFLLFFLSHKRFHRIVYSVIILNFFIIMSLTQTRGVYVAIALSIVYLVILFFLTGKFKIGTKSFIGSVGIILILSISILIIDQMRREFSFVDRFKKFASIDVEKGQLDSRTGAWQYGIQAINQMTLSGKIVGMGSKYLGAKKVWGVKRGGWPHCLYLSYILRDGFLGMGLLLIFFAWLYKTSIKGILREKSISDRELFLIAVGLHLAFIIFIVDESKIEFIRHDRSQNIFWLFFGLITVCSKLIDRSINQVGK